MTVDPIGPAVGSAPDTLRQAIALELRVALTRKRISGSELARRLSKPQGWVSRRLTGEVAIDMDDLELIASAIDCGVELLLPDQRPPAQSGSMEPPVGIEPTTYSLDAHHSLLIAS